MLVLHHEDEPQPNGRQQGDWRREKVSYYGSGRSGWASRKRGGRDRERTKASFSLLAPLSQEQWK